MRTGATWSQGDIVKVAMGFLSKLFDKGEEPERSCSDELLGPLEYFEDRELGGQLQRPQVQPGLRQNQETVRGGDCLRPRDPQ